MQAPGPILSTRETNCLDLPGPLRSPSASRPTAFAMTRRSLSLCRTMSDLIVRRIVQGARPGPSGRRQRLEQSRQLVYVEQQGRYSEAEPLGRGCVAIKEKSAWPRPSGCGLVAEQSHRPLLRMDAASASCFFLRTGARDPCQCSSNTTFNVASRGGGSDSLADLFIRMNRSVGVVRCPANWLRAWNQASYS